MKGRVINLRLKKGTTEITYEKMWVITYDDSERSQTGSKTDIF